MAAVSMKLINTTFVVGNVTTALAVVGATASSDSTLIDPGGAAIDYGIDHSLLILSCLDHWTFPSCFRTPSSYFRTLSRC